MDVEKHLRTVRPADTADIDADPFLSKRDVRRADGPLCLKESVTLFRRADNLNEPVQGLNVLRTVRLADTASRSVSLAYAFRRADGPLCLKRSVTLFRGTDTSAPSRPRSLSAARTPPTKTTPHPLTPPIEHVY